MLFFEFLEQINKDYRDIGIDEMADFIRWLQNPHQDVKVSSIFPNQPIRKAKTVNIIINTVLGFYDYLMRHEDYSIQLTERLKNKYLVPARDLKALFTINKNKSFSSHILKLKVPNQPPKTLSKDQIALIMNACVNI